MEKDKKKKERTEQPAGGPAETAEAASNDARAAQDEGAQPEPKSESPENPPESVEELKKMLSEAEDRFTKQKDQLLRTAAEYDNFRKRTEREKTNIYSDATAAAVLEFLPVSDNLSRALEQKDCSAEDLRKGVEMVERQMQSALEKLGVEEMGKEGDAFDPSLHNAVAHVEDENAGENTVTKVFQKGYKIGDRVVRHAMVQVAN